MTQSIDLNLLTVLDALLREGSVTGAAERLHLSAPAASRALGRLRRALDDPILVRAGRGLVPTPFALSLAPRVSAIVEQARGLLTADRELDLSTVERVCTIRANDAWIAVFGGPLLAKANREAPGVRLRFVAEGEEDVRPLRDGTIDLDVGVIDELGPEIRVEPLGEEAAIPIVRAGHPLATGRLTWRKLAAHPHIAISRRGRAHGPLDEILADHGLRRTVVAVTPTATTAVHLVLQSDAVCLVMGSFAALAEQTMGVRALRPPQPLPTRTRSMAWHPRSEADPVHRWLRSSLAGHQDS